uniref:Tetraspanin n=1 Tax=Cyprinus carpio TaxID=7962 RepID=A0A8C1V686_CYPCA
MQSTNSEYGSPYLAVCHATQKLRRYFYCCSDSPLRAGHYIGLIIVFCCSEINQLVMDGCAQMCKCFLILFNILFALVGFGLVALGMWLRFGAETRGFFDIDLKTTQFNIGVMVLVVTGVLMLLVAIIGDCGACSHSKSALSVFSGLLFVLIIIEITAGVMAFMWSDRVADELVNFYNTIYAQYLNTRSPGQAVTLKLFHNAFDCCGIGGPIEVFVRDTCPDGNVLQKLTYSSCPGVIKNVFASHAPLVLGGFLGMAGIMTLALVCSFVLRRHVSPYYVSPRSYVLLTSSPSVVFPPPSEDVSLLISTHLLKAVSASLVCLMDG